MLVLAYNKFGYIRFIANKILEYTYTHKLATTIPTMTSVTKIKQMKAEKNADLTDENVKEEKIKNQKDTNLQLQAAAVPDSSKALRQRRFWTMHNNKG